MNKIAFRNAFTVDRASDKLRLDIQKKIESAQENQVFSKCALRKMQKMRHQITTDAELFVSNGEYVSEEKP